MELFFEWLLIIVLITGILWFFGTTEFFEGLIGFIAKIVVLIGCGVLFGVGIHLINIIFGW